jgi:hypothetical protein
MNDTDRSRRHAQIAGRQWRQGEEVLTRPMRPGARRPPEAHATFPHPDERKRKLGWRLAVIFVTLLLCLIAGILTG